MSRFDTAPTISIAIPLDLNDNVHASPFEVRPRYFSNVIQLRMASGNDVNDARYRARSGILLARIMIIVVMFLAMVVVMVMTVVMRLLISLLGHPKSHASIADDASQFADAL
jgi:Flp pilus assembly protein TadB